MSAPIRAAPRFSSVMLSRIITRGLSKSGRITELTTKLEDKPGSLIQLLEVISKNGANIISINHSREGKQNDISSCLVSIMRPPPFQLPTRQSHAIPHRSAPNTSV